MHYSSSPAFTYYTVRGSRVVLACSSEVDNLRLRVARKRASLRGLRAKMCGVPSEVVPVLVISPPRDYVKPVVGMDPIPGLLASPIQSSKVHSLKRRPRKARALLPRLCDTAGRLHRHLLSHSPSELIGEYDNEKVFAHMLDSLFTSSRGLGDAREGEYGSSPRRSKTWTNFGFMRKRRVEKEHTRDMGIEDASAVKSMDAFFRSAEEAAASPFTVEDHISTLSSSSSSRSSSFSRSSSMTPSLCSSRTSVAPSLYDSPALPSTLSVNKLRTRQTHVVFSRKVDGDIEAQLSASLTAGTTALSVGYAEASILTRASSNESLYGNDLLRDWEYDEALALETPSQIYNIS
ncbi:hypothetical protein OF83DRAFT_1292182 [Amylostereum chailletii]|nr:hypothetical protein OF83DRAFT_1292182 [Amylostereum chailletii]